ncbi:sodium-dependent transporter [Heyndrickxia oleronia]|jgi:NSS family neurotransmitter:Na+ symporter|uniref:sodium-dependent transporter n=1 Tax=Heyndrickxia oleronia TaxID=38875 RepID=UPI0015D1E3A6|nr:sodium-dependent transporter [Heyndrickxia oleronia]NYV63966.1 sodium-dependent transporter [Bacillus sp. Gen3]MBU5212793.1 sodium-dependent transporter [Heyndrickxia oleronia]MCI1590572.1 sodium-dependent transporter [Heyndrickxia oleronia]MCI1614298.1 sodium-dependent transporter [Heyndrickxia oleronia]MCI1745046.1 sodium-dependent transporter [Heyndrickxia oleronia]
MSVSQQEQWSSKLGFILAAAGSAIGLGAIWKFPYIAGQNGGGAFFLIFILFTLLLGLPLLLAEFSIGRLTQENAVDSYRKIAPKAKWHWIGILGMIACFILLSFYSVIGGWIIIYLYKAITGQLNGLSSDQYTQVFGDTISDPIISLIVQLLFILMTIVVVARGVQKGIEQASKIMMPALFILFILLVIRSITLDGAMAGISFLLQPDFSKLTSKTILEAMGQSFFTLSVGVSVMVTYSSYLPKNQSLPRSAFSIVGMNLVIVLLAGLAIFPAVFALGLEPGAGPVLLFNVLPTVFSQLPLGMLFFIAFLILFLFAALTSAFSMLEIIVSVITKKDIKGRKKWSWIIGIAIFIFGIPSALSYGALGDVTLLGKTFFDLMDYTVSNILMPLGALLIAIFVPLKVKKSVLYEELKQGSGLKRGLFEAWYFLIRFVAPILIFVVMLDVLGVW